MQFARVPRLRLAQFPTPLEEAARLSAALGGPRVFFKRDDIAGPALGGNKVRKLEFLLADARSRGADVVLTIGGPQSNHARITAALAARLGLECILVLDGQEPTEAQGNLLLDHLVGARVVFSGYRPAAEVMDEVAAELSAQGRRPYPIPLGGSTGLGALGYVMAMVEMLAQAADMGVVVHRAYVAAGSVGTQAGLVLGARVLDPALRVVGVSVMKPRQELVERITTLAAEGAALLGMKVKVAAEEVVVFDEYVGAGYGIPTDGCLEAIRLVARTEGVLLDPVYTGKAMAALLDHVHRGEIASTENVVFWHTGGSPALFAYKDFFQPGRGSVCCDH